MHALSAATRRNEKTPSHKRWRWYYAGKLDSALDLVGTEASGTSVHMARSTVHDSLNPLNIGLPGTIGTSVGVGDLNTKGNALATIITLRHTLHLQSTRWLVKITPRTGA